MSDNYQWLRIVDPLQNAVKRPFIGMLSKTLSNLSHLKRDTVNIKRDAVNVEGFEMSKTAKG